MSMNQSLRPVPRTSLTLEGQIRTGSGLSEEEKRRYLLSFNEEELQRPPFDSFRWYLALHRLPRLRLGPTAPPLREHGHRLHLNKLSVAAALHRCRFNTIVPMKVDGFFDSLALAFCSHALPAVEDYGRAIPKTGYELTLTAKPLIPPVNSFQDFNSWLLNFPFQTLTRTMHIAYYDQLRDWNVTAVPHALHIPAFQRTAQNPDPDSEIWRTYVYRKSSHSAPEFGTYYFSGATVDVLGECKLVLAVQPPWILSEADINIFLKAEMIPPYNEASSSSQPVYNSGQRIWAKLWDECVRHRCHHWVLSNYQQWVFGVFSPGYSAGQILFRVNHDNCVPTVLQCLAFHVASAMGISHHPLIENPEPIELLNNPAGEVPVTTRTEDMEYPDSGSDWDGMDVEPDISAGISEYCFSSSASVIQSVCGSTQNPRPPALSRKRSRSILAWTEKVSHTGKPLTIQQLPKILRNKSGNGGPSNVANERQNSVSTLSRRRSQSILAWTEKVSHMGEPLRTPMIPLLKNSESGSGGLLVVADEKENEVPNAFLPLQPHVRKNTRSVLAVVPESQDEPGAVC